MSIIKGFRPKFIISVLYINDMNIIGTLGEFYIDNSQQLTNPTVVRHFEAEKELFRHCKKYEILLGPEVPYLSAIGAVMYIIVLAEQDDSGMDSNTFLSTSSILKRLYQIMRQDNCGLTCNRDVSTILYEDIVSVSKATTPIIYHQSSFSPMTFKKKCDINIHKIQSCNNLADLFTKSLPTSKFEKMVRNIGMRRFKKIKSIVEEDWVRGLENDGVTMETIVKNKTRETKTRRHWHTSRVPVFLLNLLAMVYPPHEEGREERGRMKREKDIGNELFGFDWVCSSVVQKPEPPRPPSPHTPGAVCTGIVGRCEAPN
ncbi:hypothetical protein LXL04_036784 [Taraxacum kok-saghyz]